LSIERIFYPEHNMVLSMFYGKLTHHELTQHVIDMNREYEKCTHLFELANCRYLTDISTLNSQGLTLAASLEKDQPRTFESKGAIVVDSDVVYGLARVFATIAAESRIDSRVYRNLDDAIVWLEVGALSQEIKGHDQRIEAIMRTNAAPTA